MELLGWSAGFRAIGCGVALSAFSAVFINAALGPNTVPVRTRSLSLTVTLLGGYVACYSVRTKK
jgi:hypothetical protein